MAEITTDMRGLLACLQVYLKQELDGDPEVIILLDPAVWPPSTTPPFIGLKDGEVDIQAYPQKHRDELLTVGIYAYVPIVTVDQGDPVMGDINAKGTLLLIETIKDLVQNELIDNTFQFVGYGKETGSQLIFTHDIDDSPGDLLMRKGIFTIWEAC